MNLEPNIILTSSKYWDQRIISMSIIRSGLYKRMTFMLALSCVFLVRLIGFLSGQSVKKHDDHFRLAQDHRGLRICALDPATQNLSVRSSLECSNVCRMNSNCNSFNYLDYNKTCQIYVFLPACFGEIESCSYYRVN